MTTRLFSLLVLATAFLYLGSCGADTDSATAENTATSPTVAPSATAAGVEAPTAPSNTGPATPESVAMVATTTTSTPVEKPAPTTPKITTAAPATEVPAAAPGRALNFNGRALDANGLAIVEQLEMATGTKLPNGAYWYDPVCGAFGVWNGPVLTFIPPNLALGGKLPANASGSGTGVFINGRELHVFDVLYLQHLLGPIQPGRYFTDAMGNAGLEGGPVLINLVLAAQQRGGFSSYSSNSNTGTRSSISSEGVSFTNSTGNTISWYPGLGSSVSE